jgi:ectoine hydroxylase-related dioxygenase (phytanoyl-CoA dioxygenase family)
MPYPEAAAEDIAFFRQHGWLVVRDAIDPEDVARVAARCDEILANPETMAFDWAWQKGTPREARAFRIVQSGPTRFWPELNDEAFRHWAVSFAGALMGEGVEFWYDQFLAKPPGNEAPTYWHQDEGYWGRNLHDKGVTCWMPFHDVDPSNGCMHFIDGGHQEGVLEHRRPEHLQSDLLCCEVDESRAVACPLSLGDVTFHHGKTPHMTPANVGDEWRRALTQHLRTLGCPGEGDHYPWKIYVNQFNGKVQIPESR